MLCFPNAKIHSENNKPSSDTSRGGFTLVEVMVATVLSLIIISAGFGALMQGYKLVESARDITRASQILQSEIEDLRTYDWATLETLPMYTTYAPQSSFTEAYSERYSVTRGIFALSGTQRIVSLVVNWESNDGTARDRQYLTLVTKDGLYDYYYRSF